MGSVIYGPVGADDFHDELNILTKMCFVLPQRLAEIAHSLLKMSPYDPDTMAGRGLRRYLNEVLPVSEWAQETMRPALIMVIRRLDRTFTKIAKKPAIRVSISDFKIFYHSGVNLRVC